MPGDLCYDHGVRQKLLCLFALIAGCSGSGDEVLPAAVPDSTPGDTGALDTGARDTSTVEDTFVPVDTESDAADTTEVMGDTAPAWPSCDSKPSEATTSTIAQIWIDNPAMPRFTWVSGAVVTGISHNACAADRACQIFVQEGSATTLAGAAKPRPPTFAGP